MVKSGVAAITPPSSPPGPAPSPTHGRGVANSVNLPSPRPQEAPKAEQAKAAPTPTTTAALPPAPAAAARPNTAVVADIQRELSRRGFYDGVVDGRYGPRTDAAIRDFEQAAGLQAEHRTRRGAAARDPAFARPLAAGRASAGADTAGASPIRSLT